MFSLIYNLKNIENHNDVLLCLEDFYNLFNIDIDVIGEENIYHGGKIIVPNHTSILDGCIMYSVFGCKLVSSNLATKISIIKQFIKKLPIIIIQRGAGRAFEQIKRNIKDNDDVCIFPEGMMHHKNVLLQFRTGAFKLNKPVQPVIIKYKPNIQEFNTTHWLTKMLSTDKIKIIVKILKPEFPPFTQEKIDYIRRKMAYIGNYALSECSNRDIRD